MYLGDWLGFLRDFAEVRMVPPAPRWIKPVGYSVTDTWTGRRRSCDRITKRNNVRKNTVGTTKKSEETIFFIWFAKNVRQLCEGGF